jgi:mRNA interferase MazF
MRQIHLARAGGAKTRPVLILTREIARPLLTSVTVAPITSTMRGLRTEVSVGKANGLDHDCVVSCDNVMTIPASQLLRQVGYLLPGQEAQLTAALMAAYDLQVQ